MWFLAQIYIPLCGGVLLGVVASALLGWLGKRSPRRASWQARTPLALGRFLFWLGVPGSLIHFLRQTDLSGGVWMAPIMAWVTFAIAFGLAWGWLQVSGQPWPRATKGIFLLSSMVGNTGYIGYPIVLLLPQLGTAYFGWAVFYDLLGTVFGAYGVGAMIGAYYGQGVGQGRSLSPWRQSLNALVRAPTFPAFALGLLLRPVPFPGWLDLGLQGFAWSMVMLSLVLMGMRLQQLRSWQNLRPALMSTLIRMAIAPVIIGVLLTLLGWQGAPRLVIILQSAMPAAFANLVLAETFDLDRDLAVTCLGVSSALLLVTLPLWLGLFPV
ncbi:AEC family transporter [Leptolyngbya iicbica LK]|uniref:AEC family transporter n=2 Tax=Cyanophyceae TaxID=3028117 RepID=A0A4Q7E214_9CYAN|nr:AEC family transporter [Leptolyngbya sp. LK]